MQGSRAGVRTTWLGLLRRRSVWVPTWRLWFVLAILAALGILALRGLHAFLSLTAPVRASVLVVEGWLPDYALAKARDEFESNEYQLIITTGGPVSQGSFFSDHTSYADLAAATLAELGVDGARAAPARSAHRNRTYEAALGLKKWLTENAPRVRAMNVVSLGVHARRSRMMYQRALGDDYQIGIIAVLDRDYEPSRWWRYSAGFKGVLTEGLAWVHAAFLFNPDLEIDRAPLD